MRITCGIVTRNSVREIPTKAYLWEEGNFGREKASTRLDVGDEACTTFSEIDTEFFHGGIFVPLEKSQL